MNSVLMPYPDEPEELPDDEGETEEPTPKPGRHGRRVFVRGERLEKIVPYDKRSKRYHAVRAKTLTVPVSKKRRLTVVQDLELQINASNPLRPQTRGACVDGPRPCPWVSCEYHLYLDVHPRTGSIKLNFPELEPHEIGHSCALDIADDGGLTLEDVGAVMNITRERVRQLEISGLRRIEVIARKLKDET